MRICILGEASTIHVRRIASGLAERGHQVRVVSRRKRSIPGATLTPFRIPRWSLRRPARWHRRRITYMQEIMREHDVVHVHFLHDWGLTPEIIEAGRLVVSPWGSDIVKPPDVDAFPAELVRMRQELLRAAHGITVWGPTFAAVTADFAGLPIDRIGVVPLGVDLEAFQPRPRKSGGPPTIGYFKGLKAVYGPTVWIRAMPMVRARMPDARFEMIGTGPLLDECRTLARSLGVDDAVRWFDDLPHETLADRIARWDLSVMPSICESFGLAALESSALRVPVVASRVGGIPETVRDGVTGLLVPPDDPDALADAVVELLGDPDRRAAMGRAGRAMVVADYDWSSCLGRWVDVYRRVCGERQASEHVHAAKPPVRGNALSSSS